MLIFNYVPFFFPTIVKLTQHFFQWLENEEEIQVYIGRVYDPRRHTKEDSWASWIVDIETAEKILIYKYSANYNTKNIYEKTKLPFKKVKLIHVGEVNRLNSEDNAPEDYELA